MSLPETVVRGEGTVSDRIRALDAAGYPRAEIARILNKRYQHVRNVLEADASRARGGDAPHRRSPAGLAGAPSPGRPAEAVRDVVRMELRGDGSIVLPPPLLARLGLAPAHVVIGRMEGDRLVIASAAENLRMIRNTIRAYLPEGVDLVEGLIAERRRENAKDERGE